MTKQKMTLTQAFENFNLTVKESLNFIQYCRDAELQALWVEKLENSARLYISFKNQARSNKNGKGANLFFGCHNIINSVKCCIQSILLLKEGKPKAGWDKLIDAQEHLEFASLSKELVCEVDEYFNHLKMMEKVLFPPFKIYHSPGIIESPGKCNICQNEIHACDHITGVLYDGIVCFEVERKPIQLDHSSLVENPKDRRCTINKISTDDGYMKDYFTLKKLEKIPEEKRNDGHMLIEGIIIQLNNLEIN